MKNDECMCEGIADPIELALCLAPPRGEYEVEIKMRSNTSIVINEDGIFLRTLVTDETLPFVKTYERPMGLDAVADKVGDPAGLLCKTVRMLKKAADGGSTSAARKIKSCEDIIRDIEAKCGGEETL